MAPPSPFNRRRQNEDPIFLFRILYFHSGEIVLVGPVSTNNASLLLCTRSICNLTAAKGKNTKETMKISKNKC
jgi:hypothetical protein